MSSHLTPLDISTSPELLRLVEEVATTKKPRELKRENTIVAVLMPTTRKRNTRMQEALALAGAWKDIPSDEIEERLHRIRHASQPTLLLTLDDA